MSEYALRAARLLGREVVAEERVERGYTPADRRVVRFGDGSSVFVKTATSDLTAGWLRREASLYGALEAAVVPRLVGFEDDPAHPTLVLEDLSGARWPPPWEAGDVERVLAALDEIHRLDVQLDLEGLEGHRPSLSGWNRVARDPGPFLGLGLASHRWLESALPSLLEAEAAAVLDGDDVVHFDVRSDNICFQGPRTVLVDWNGVMRGNGVLDVVAWLPSLRLEGGPLPEDVLDGPAELAAMVCGYFAAQAGLPPIPDTPRVRWIQLRQLRVALPWVCRLLGLPQPDLPWAQTTCAQLAADLDAGRLDEEGWYAAVEEALVDAYLATDDPRAASGKSGDEDEWRWSRELVLDALPAGGDVLDVGCANGYLMESLHRWGAERGVRVEPFGVEISARLASVARRRLPRWEDRIWVGNVRTWSPPRRFDLVHTGLDYVPRGRRRELVDRIRREYLTPSGRLVLRAARVQAGVPGPDEELAAIGVRPDGILEAVHPVTGELRRTAWVGA